MMRLTAAAILALVLPTFALAGEMKAGEMKAGEMKAGEMKAGEMKAGWTAEMLAPETEECTRALVDGAWENTKREQGADPSLPMSDEIRKQLEPQIAAFRKLCSCAVRAGAEHYTKAEADKTPADLDKFVNDTIESGKCKLE